MEMMLTTALIDEKLAGIEKKRLFYRDQLADLAKGDSETEWMEESFEVLARLEGERKAWTEVSHQMHKQDAETIIPQVLTDRLCYGADDRSSGRGNDRARSKFDGYKDASRDILVMVRH